MGDRPAMPTLFVGHGSPMHALIDSRYSRAWRALGASIARPEAILVVSAHWYVRESALTAMERPRTIHDFAGFPPALFALDYRAPGAPELAQELAHELGDVPVALDSSWGLDHGAWSVLVHLYPDADVPVVQLSIDRSRPARFHLELGARLANLRAAGVLVLGSGNVVHNLGALDFSRAGAPFDWAARFDGFVTEALGRGDADALVDYRAHPDAARAVPTPEHYLPLLYALGAAGPGARAEAVIEGFEAGALSMLSVRFGG